jgi:glycine/D-amino acid oxidase-like deaminating enzyme
MGLTADGYPHCGSVPGKDNQFIMAGFNGAGMSHIFLTARGIARMIRDGIPYEETGIPRIFKASKERLRDDAGGQ